MGYIIENGDTVRVVSWHGREFWRYTFVFAGISPDEARSGRTGDGSKVTVRAYGRLLGVLKQHLVS